MEPKIKSQLTSGRIYLIILNIIKVVAALFFINDSYDTEFLTPLLIMFLAGMSGSISLGWKIEYLNYVSIILEILDSILCLFWVMYWSFFLIVYGMGLLVILLLSCSIISVLISVFTVYYLIYGIMDKKDSVVMSKIENIDFNQVTLIAIIS